MEQASTESSSRSSGGHSPAGHSSAGHSSGPERRASAVARDTMEAFREHFGLSSSEPPVFAARAPGRVNLLGGHTDYTGGFVLPATIDRTVCVTLRQRDDRVVRLRSLDFEETVEYTLDDMDPDALPGWARYVAGVADALGEEEALDEEASGTKETFSTGFEGVVHGDVPLGAGLSSSAALEVATALSLEALFSLDIDPVRMAKLCQHAEHVYAGVECGILDQFASRLGRRGHALFLDCRSLEHEHVPLLLEERKAALVVIDSGVRRELAASKYNERRHECEEATRFFQQFAGEQVESLRDVSEALLDEHGEELDATLRKRARHVVGENERVRRGVDFLREGQLEAFGALVNDSHASLAGDYEVSCAELDVLAKTAKETEGVFGARMTGAGFGGCVVVLAKAEAVDRLKRRTREAYAEQFDREPDVYVIERGEEARSFASDSSLSAS